MTHPAPTIIAAPEDFNVADLYIDVHPLLAIPVYLKCEQMNFAGSIKLKTARSMVDRAEREGRLLPGDVLIESSSGNLGIALSLVASSRGYHFICVTDVRCNEAAMALMRSVGAQVIVVTEAHPERGLLGARIDLVHQIAAANSRYVWLNQYVNTANPEAHSATTGPELLASFPDVERIFVGVGTSGTAVGIADHLRIHAPHVRLIGIDSVGSVTFGGPPLTRHIPGLGSGVVPPIFRADAVDEHLCVPEAETIRMCRELAARGFVLGGSTGTVLAGARQWFAAHPDTAGTVSLAIAPDAGERYLTSLFDDCWVAERFGDALLHGQHRPGEPAVAAATAATVDGRRSELV